jgi:hypothetical protein
VGVHDLDKCTDAELIAMIKKGLTPDLKQLLLVDDTIEAG